MKWTNRGGFPEAIVKAITNDSYSKGDADFSVTELINPPQIKALQKLYESVLVKDVSENIWMLLGTSVHNILEEATDTPIQKELSFYRSQLQDIRESIRGEHNTIDTLKDILDREPLIANSHIETEFRASINIGGYIISGAVDWYDKDNLVIEDYKVVTTWKFTNGDWEDYIKQLNMYKYLFAENGRACKTLRINAIFKDWKAREMGKDNYPDYPVKQIEIEVWDSLDTLQYILDRVKLHSKARRITTAEQLAEQYPCTDKERWAKKEFAVIKKGASRASKVCPTKNEAMEYFSGLTNAIEYEIQDRSSYRRCEEYCDVAQFCKQYNYKGSIAKADTKVNLDTSDIVADLLNESITNNIDESQTESIHTNEVNESIEESREEDKSQYLEESSDKIEPKSLADRLKAKLNSTPEPKSIGTTDEIFTHMEVEAEASKSKVNENYGHKVDTNQDLGNILGSMGL